MEQRPPTFGNLRVGCRKIVRLVLSWRQDRRIQPAFRLDEVGADGAAGQRECAQQSTAARPPPCKGPAQASQPLGPALTKARFSSPRLPFRDRQRDGFLRFRGCAHACCVPVAELARTSSAWLQRRQQHASPVESAKVPVRCVSGNNRECENAGARSRAFGCYTAPSSSRIAACTPGSAYIRSKSPDRFLNWATGVPVPSAQRNMTNRYGSAIDLVPVSQDLPCMCSSMYCR